MCRTSGRPPQLLRHAERIVEDCRAATCRRGRLLQSLEHHAVAQAYQPGGDLGASDVDADGDIDRSHG
jgi:hypothetical protein